MFNPAISPFPMEQMTVMACPEGHMMKMGAMEHKMNMMKCDACGMAMKEMKMM
jgi:hypothetical protein